MKPVWFGLLLLPSSALFAQEPLYGRLRWMVPEDLPLSTEELALGDLDLDGIDDVVLESRWLRGLGGAKLGAGGAFAPNGTDTNDLELLDADGDGDLDLVIAFGGDCSPGPCELAQDEIWLNDGSGNLVNTTGMFPVAPSRSTTSVDSGDLDGDGDADLLFATIDNCPFSSGPECLGGGLDVWRNDATVFTELVDPFPDVTFSADFWAVALGDVNLDGDLDACVSRTANTSLYTNDGTGTFTYDQPAAFPGTTAREALFEDLDQDGDLDLVATAYPVSVMINDGAGLLLPIGFTLPDDSASRVAAVDLAGDGDLDLVLGNDERVLIWENVPVGSSWTFVSNGEVPDLLNGGDVVAGDLDGDGDGDALCATPFSQDFAGFGQGLQLLLGGPSGMLTRATNAVPWSEEFTERALMFDADGDGDADVATTSLWGGELYLGNGTGQLVLGDAGSLGGYSQNTDMATGDIDHDGDIDVLKAADAEIQLHANVGGTFLEIYVLPGSSGTNAVATGDADGDGWVDVFYSDAAVGTQLALNDDGVFGDSIDLVATFSMNAWRYAVGDVDLDGDIDLIEGAGGVRLMQNTPSGFIYASGLLPAVAGVVEALALGDIDGDADLDLFAGMYNTSGNPPNRLFRNIGPHFVDASADLSGLSQSTKDALFADADVDGDLDLVLAPILPAKLLLTNNGAGVFADATARVPLPRLSPTCVAAGDLDGDGAPDLFLGSYGGSAEVWFQLESQHAWSTWPRVGKALGFELYADPGSPWFLAWAIGTASFPLPPFGTLLLDPFTLHLFASGTTDAEGTAATEVLVPANPMLVGWEIYTQALSGLPLELGNLEASLLSGL